MDAPLLPQHPHAVAYWMGGAVVSNMRGTALHAMNQRDCHGTGTTNAPGLPSQLPVLNRPRDPHCCARSLPHTDLQ